MCANEKKFQSFVGEIFLRFCDVRCFPSDLLEKLLRFLPHFLSTHGVNHVVACDMQQPCFRFFRNAFAWPSLQCRDERVAERIFRAGDVARSRREISDQSSIRSPRNAFDRSVGC